MEKNKQSWLVITMLLAFAVCYIYFGQRLFPFAGFEVYYTIPISAILVLIAIITFLISPKLARGAVILQQLKFILFPICFPIIWSLAVWIIKGVNFVELRKAIMSLVYLLAGVFFVTSMVYLAGAVSVKIFLWALLISNAIAMLQVMSANGVSAFLKEFIRLVVTFAGETGPIMLKMEWHSVTYALGLYLVFLCFDKSKSKWKLGIIAITIVFFFMGLKRISAIGIAGAVLLGYFLLRVKKYPDVEKFLLKVIGGLFIIFVLMYVGAIFFGLYTYLDEIGIDTSGRNLIYEAYREYYEFSPFFIGNGTGWVENKALEWAAAGAEITMHTHCDYLRFFIELGMIGCTIWCYLRCNLQVKASYRILGSDGGAICLALVAYLAITYLTDKTSTQELLNNSFAIMILSYNLENREKIKKKQMEIENQKLSEPFWEELNI